MFKFRIQRLINLFLKDISTIIEIDLSVATITAILIVTFIYY